MKCNVIIMFYLIDIMVLIFWIIHLLPDVGVLDISINKITGRYMLNLFPIQNWLLGI